MKSNCKKLRLMKKQTLLMKKKLIKRIQTSDHYFRAGSLFYKL